MSKYLPDVIWPPSQELLPTPRLPELEAHHVLVIVTHGGIAYGAPSNRG